MGESAEEGHPEDEGEPPVEHTSDELLAMLVDGVTKRGGEFGITLWIGGAVVSGTAVGIVDYLEGLSEEFASAKGSAADSMAEMFEVAGRETRETLEDLRQTEATHDLAGHPSSVRYIHLRGAHTFSPEGHALPSGRGVWWRGRLDSVAGWCFGELRTG